MEGRTEKKRKVERERERTPPTPRDGCGKKKKEEEERRDGENIPKHWYGDYGGEGEISEKNGETGKKKGDGAHR